VFDMSPQSTIGRRLDAGHDRLHRLLLRLYPDDVRFAYGREMTSDFQQEYAEARRRGWTAVARLSLASTSWLLADTVAERINSLYSHRTFHSRCRPDAGKIRPPDMGKREWFQLD
jgi:hypothetical protein